MRKQWFGDSRDYVKWTCLLREAGDHHTLVYAVMLRDDDRFGGSQPDERVVKFFDSHKDFSALGELFPNRFVLFDREYDKAQATDYFHALQQVVKEKQLERHNVLIFLDPDTGLEPKSSHGHKHVRRQDIKALAGLLDSGDKIVLYQHARHSRTWQADVREELSALTKDLSCTVHEPFRLPQIAHDVCFFIITKS